MIMMIKIHSNVGKGSPLKRFNVCSFATMQEELLNGSSQFETQSLSYTVVEEVEYCI